MSPKVPAPSKGALRALRTLALGTTCTIAFSTAIITEDRRRRIRAARVVHENNRKIKALSRYHSSDSAPAAGFEDEVVRYGYFEPVPPERLPRVVELQWSETPPVLGKDEVDAARRTTRSRNPCSKDKAHHGKDERSARQEEVDRQYVALKDQTDRASCGPQFSVPTSNVDTPRKRAQPIQNLAVAVPVVRHHAFDSALIEKGPKRRRTNNLGQTIAASIDEILDADDILSVDSASETFFDLLPRDWQRERLGRPLIEVTQKLINACIHHQRMVTAAKILTTFCQTGLLDEETFVSLHSETILRHIISTKEFRTRETKDRESFQQAVSIFCVKLSEKFKSRYPGMADIGESISEVAFLDEDYHLFDKIYWRTQAWCPDNNAIRVDKLIFAQQSLKHHKKVVDYFLRLVPKTGLDFETFFQAALAAVESAFSLENLSKAETILQVVSDTSEDLGHPLRIIFLLRILGEHWRMTRDFDSLRALFERLEKYVARTNNPGRLYSAMIQICVENGQISDIPQYFDKSALYTKSILGGKDIRTRCNLTLAKAMIDDWAGVEDELKDIKNHVYCKSHHMENHKMVYSASFTPILKIFVEQHDVTQSEDFLHRCVDQYGIPPNQFISNIMVGVYAKARELDSIPEWLKYAQSRGLDVNATTFNTLLQALVSTWHVNYTDLKPIYDKVKEWNESLVNEVTARICGLSAMKSNIAGTRLEGKHYRQPRIVKLRMPRNSHTVKYAMNIAMLKSKFHEALEIYEVAQRDNIYLHTSVLDMAIEAVHQIGGDGAPDKVADLLAAAQRNGKDITYALPKFLVHQLRYAHIRGRHVDVIVREAQKTLSERGLSLPLQAATEGVAILVQRSQFRQAIDLWTSFLDSPGKEPYAHDLPILSVLLKAYIGIYDCDGIRWVVKTLISQNIKSDRQFRKILRNAAKSTQLEIKDQPRLEYLKIFRGVIKESLRDIHELSVLPGIRARKYAEKKVLEIMMLAGAQAEAEKYGAEQPHVTKRDQEMKTYRPDAVGDAEADAGKEASFVESEYDKSSSSTQPTSLM